MVKKLFVSYLLASVGLLGLAQEPRGCPTEHSKLKPYRNTHLVQLPGVVKIKEDCGMCTGWVAAPGIIITAQHCLGVNMTAVFEGLPGHPESQLTVERAGSYPIDEASDILILKGDTRGVTPFKLAIPSSGDLCLAAGYGGIDNHEKVTACIYTGQKDPFCDLQLFLGDIDYGDSGGPILNRNEEVIGMSVQLNIEGKRLFYSVPVLSIQALLVPQRSEKPKNLLTSPIGSLPF
jgi:hypothetical protein